MSCRLCVVCCILGMCLAICWSSGGIRRGLGGYLGAFGSHLGPSWAMLGPSWGYLGKTWGLLGLTLGVDHQAWKTHTFLKASLEHAIAVFDYKPKWICDGFENAVFSGHQKRTPCRNVKIALALRLCSEIALQCQDQCKNHDRSQPEMIIKPMDFQ